MAGRDQIEPEGEAIRLTRMERLTAQFYEWERRGRGWQLWECPVSLEPPFRPFFFHYAEPGPATDDARKPTFFSSLIEGILGRPSARPVLPAPSLYELPEPDPELFLPDAPLVELQLTLPPGTKIVKEAAERVLMNLAYASQPVAFEVIGTEGAITSHSRALILTGRTLRSSSLPTISKPPS